MATYKPPQTVADAAQRAIAWIGEGYAGSGWYRTGMGGDDSDSGLVVFQLTKGDNFQGTVHKL